MQPKRKNKVPIKVIIGIGLLLIVFLGAAAAFFLSGQSQDIRNQASTGDNTGTFCINTPMGTLQHGQRAKGICGDIRLSGQSPAYRVEGDCGAGEQTFYACNDGKLLTVCKGSSVCSSQAACGVKNVAECVKSSNCAWIADKTKCVNKRDRQEQLKSCYALCTYSAGCTCPAGCEKTSVSPLERCSNY